MASTVIGAAVIRILPQTTGFAGKVRREMQTAASASTRPFRDLGFNIKRQLTSAFSAGLASLNRFRAGALNLSRFFARNFTIPIGIALAAVIKLTTTFESGMLRVEALITRVGDETQNVAGEMRQLSETARELGRTTEFTANQASEAMQNFALAGFDTNEILQATENTLSLASAGQVQLAQAADTTATAIRAFNLDADDSGRVADVLTQTFTNSNTTLEQLSQGFKFVAPVAAAAGLTFEETSAALGILSNAGLKASIAGTSLRGIITKLINPSAKAKDIIDELGIEVFDLEGNMLPLVDIVRQFEGNMRDFGIEVRNGEGDVRDLNDILAEVVETGGNAAGVFETITGLDTDTFLQDAAADFEAIGVHVFDANGTLKSFNQIMSDSNVNAVTASQAMAIFAQRAGPGMLALVSQGADALDSLLTKNLNSAGRAAEIQAKQMEGLRGSFLLVKSALEGLAIEIGLTFNDSLSESTRRLADFINHITDWVEINPRITSQIVKMAGALAALGPGFFLVSKALGAILFTFGVLLSPMKIFILGLVSLGVMIQRTLNASTGLRESLAETFSLLGRIIRPILTLVVTLFNTAATSITEFANILGGDLKDRVDEANDSLIEFVTEGGLRDFIFAVRDAIEAVKEWIDTTGRAVAGAVLDTLRNALSALLEVFRTIEPIARGFIEFITSEFVLKTVIGGVNLLIDAIETLAKLLRPLANFIGSNFTPIFIALGAAFLSAKIQALSLASNMTILQSRLVRSVVAPVRAASIALTRMGVSLAGVSVRVLAASTSMSFLNGATSRFGVVLATTSARLRAAGAALTRFSARMRQAGVTGQNVASALVLAFASFELSKQIAQAETLGEKLTGLGATLSTIAIAASINPIVGAVAAVTSAVTLAFATFRDETEESVVVIGDAVDDLRGKFQDFAFDVPEILGALETFFDSVSENGFRNFGILLESVDEFAEGAELSMEALARAAVEGEEAFDDFTNEFVRNALLLQTESEIFAENFRENFNIRDFSEDALNELEIFRAAFGEEFEALVDFGADKFIDETAAYEFAISNLRELLEAPISESGLQLTVNDLDKAFINFAPTTDNLRQSLLELNAVLDEGIQDAPIRELFSEQVGRNIETTIVNLKRFGLQMSDVRFTAELLRPALEAAREEQEELAEITRDLTEQYDDLERAVGDAAEELRRLKDEPVDLGKAFQDFAGSLGTEPLERFRDEAGNIPDLIELFEAPTALGDDFENFIDRTIDDFDRYLLQVATFAESEEDLARGFLFAEQALANLLRDLGVAPREIEQISELFRREGVLGISPEVLFDAPQVEDIRREAADVLAKTAEELEKIDTTVATTVNFATDVNFSDIPIRTEFREIVRETITGEEISLTRPVIVSLDPQRPFELEVTGAVADELGVDFGSIMARGLAGDETAIQELEEAFRTNYDAAFTGFVADIPLQDLPFEIRPDPIFEGLFELDTLLPGLPVVEFEVQPGEDPQEVARQLLADIDAALGFIAATEEAAKIPVGVELQDLTPLQMETFAEGFAAQIGFGLDPGGALQESLPDQVDVDLGIGFTAEADAAVSEQATAIATNAQEAIAEAGPVEIDVEVNTEGLTGENGVVEAFSEFNAQTSTISENSLTITSDLGIITEGFEDVGEAAASAALKVALSIRSMADHIAGLSLAMARLMINIASGISSFAVSMGALSTMIARGFRDPLAFVADSVWPTFAKMINGVAKRFGTPFVPSAGPAIPPVPTFHSGGVVGGGSRIGDERLIMAQDGEGVLPLDAMKRLSPEQFEALRKGGVDFTADPRDQMGGPFEDGLATAAGPARSSTALTRIPMDKVQVQVDGVITPAIESINSLFPDFVMAQVAAAAMTELVAGVLEFIRGVNQAIGDELLRRGSDISAWPVGFFFPGGPADPDLSDELDLLRAKRGQANSFPALLTFLQATGTPFRVTSTLRNTLVRGTKIPSLHNAGRAVDVVGLSGAIDSPELLAIYRAFDPAAGIIRRIYSGPGGGGFGLPGSITWADHHDHVHLALANGAVIRSRVLAELGEAGDEVVIPLDRPERAMALTLQSGLFDTLSRATQTPAGATPTAPARGSSVLGNFDGGPLSGGPGNTYNIVGVSMDQVKAEIAARDEATVRVRR